MLAYWFTRSLLRTSTCRGEANHTVNMTRDRLLSLLATIRSGTDPVSKESFVKKDSCLQDKQISRNLNRLIRHLARPVDPTTPDIPDATIVEACEELRTLGYQPSVMQLAKVFIGSRSIVDHNLKAMTSYNRYRGIYTRQIIHRHLMDFHRRKPEILPEFPEKNVKTVHEPWREIDFFRNASFDKLDAAKENELRSAVTELGLHKPCEHLPKHMADTRATFPRSYEPWLREEQALLIEAMCYTNQSARLAKIFGRSANAIEKAGQKLIWESKERQRQQVA